jgi:hypothetical protein
MPQELPCSRGIVRLRLHSPMKSRRTFLILLAVLATPAFADIKLPAIISDNMVV